MALGLPIFGVLKELPRDGIILFSTRFLRLFSYGFLSVVLYLYLSAQGLSAEKIGLVLTLTLLGDMVISLWLTTHADRIGRRRMLIVGAVLMIFAGVAFVLTNNVIFLAIAGTIGVISPSGNEIGPFLPIEQASLSQIVPYESRTSIFAWYALTGSLATALGALFSGYATQQLQNYQITELNSYRSIVLMYAAMGLILSCLFLMLSSSTEATDADQVKPGAKTWLGLHQSRNVVLKLAALFSLDAFGGGFVMQTLLVAWLYKRHDVDLQTLGWVFFICNLLAAVSALAAGWVAKKVGLINCMVFTHLPSNVFLILVPLMPTYPLALVMLFCRFAISQMDVPTRQAYTIAVVKPDERSAASGVTSVARSIGAAISPLIAAPLIAHPNIWIMSIPIFLSGGLKIVYDLLIYWSFVSLKPIEEQKKQAIAHD